MVPNEYVITFKKKYSWRIHISRIHIEQYRWNKRYFVEEMNQISLFSKRHEKNCTTLNYIEHFFILASAVTQCVSISAFTSLVGIPIGIASSAVGLKRCMK